MATMESANGHTAERPAIGLLHGEIIPGTEVMRDVGGAHFTHDHGNFLVPQPSDDPTDPLNWSRTWKILAIISQVAYTFVTVMAALSVAPMFPLLGKEFMLDEQQLSLITGVAVITLGYVNFFIVPFSNILGRRLTSLIFGIFVVATQIWVAEAKSYRSLLAARAMNGLATGTNESLMMQVVADIFFLHERGFWSGVYFAAYFMGLFIGPIISGPLADKHGWRSFFWLSTGLSVFNLVLLLFFFPETKFHRTISSRTPPDGALNKVPNTEKNHSENDENIDRIRTASTALVGKGRPSKHDFMLWRAPDSRWKDFLIRDVTTPLHAFFIPIIFWAGLLVAGSANLLLMWNLTESSLLASPPYNWSPAQVGYANFAFAVGGVFGLATAGQFSDWIAKRATARNDSVREPEMRLPALIPFVILTAIGIVIGGLGYQHLWSWETVVVVGYGLTGLCVTSIPTIAIAYAIDCYKPISGEIMVVATVLKNTQGFGMSYWVAPLAAKHGFLTVSMVQFGLLIGACLLGIPMYIFGKRLRYMTKDSKMHQMEELI